LVNSVLQEARLRAIRNGSIKNTPSAPSPVLVAKAMRAVQAALKAHDASPKPPNAAQLELPFGGAAKQAAPAFGQSRAPRGIRLV
jgi:hypothetical protein